MLHKLIHNAFMRLIRSNWWTIGSLTVKAAEAIEDRCTTRCANS